MKSWWIVTRFDLDYNSYDCEILIYRSGNIESKSWKQVTIEEEEENYSSH